MNDHEDFSLLVDKLPTMVVCGENKYFIDTRTSRALQALFVLSMEEVPAINRLETIQKLIITNIEDVRAEDIEELDKQIFDYLAGYPRREKGSESKREVLSYTQDHDLIVASFREAYGFTLTEIQSMHWWLFLAYLNGLPSDTRLGNVIQIRLTDITSKDSPETRRAKIKAKQAVAIHPRRLQGGGEDGYDIISMGLEQGD